MFRVEVIGNLGADAEVKNANGASFVALRVAHSEKWTDAQGKEVNRTQWIDVTLNDATSPLLPYLKQGVKVFVRGNGALRVYSSPKERMMMAGLTIHAREIELCGGQSEDVPRELIHPETSEIFHTAKAYYVVEDIKGATKNNPVTLIDKRGSQYNVDYHRFVMPVKQEQGGGAE